MASGTSATLTLVLDFPRLGGGVSFTDTADISATKNNDPVPGNNEATATTTVQPWADLSVLVTDAPDPVEQAAAPFSDPADTLAAKQRMSRVWALVNELSPQQRAAVTLSVREGMATRDIAVALSVSEATVRVHLHRALSTLRRRLGDDA